jgi:positive regulator of sigma E activity
MYILKIIMKQASTIEHEGVVTSIESGVIFVDIQVQSACAKCHAHGYCSAFGKKDKIIEIKAANYPHVQIGDIVNVIIKESLGFQALLLGYILPVVVLIIALFVSFSISKHEGLSAIITLSAVAAYYVGLIFFKNSIQKHFTFQLEKLDKES